MVLRVFFLLSLLQLVPCAAAEENDDLKRAEQTLAELREHHSAWPALEKDDSYSEVQHCKRAIRGLLEECDSAEGKHEIEKVKLLAAQMVKSLEASKTFDFYEYYIVWLGGGLLEHSPQYWRRLIPVLMEKIANGKRVPPQTEGDIMLGMPASFVAFLVAYNERIASDEEHVDWQKWPGLVEWVAEAQKAADQLDSPIGEYRDRVRTALRNAAQGQDIFTDANGGDEAEMKKARARRYYITMVGVLLSADTDERARVLSDLVLDSLSRSTTFEWHDYYLIKRALWLVYQYPPERPSLMRVLAQKINNRASAACNSEVLADMAYDTAVFLSRMIEYPETFLDMARVDWAGWNQFSEWLENHKNSLRFDEEKNMFTAR